MFILSPKVVTINTYIHLYTKYVQVACGNVWSDLGLSSLFKYQMQYCNYTYYYSMQYSERVVWKTRSALVLHCRGNVYPSSISKVIKQQEI